MTTIVVNALTLALESDDRLSRSHRQVFDSFDGFFLAVFAVEFVLRTTAEPTRYWTSWYNLFDFIVLIAIVSVQLTLAWSCADSETSEDLQRALRVLRAMRTLRMISFLKGLQVGDACSVHAHLPSFLWKLKRVDSAEGLRR